MENVADLYSWAWRNVKYIPRKTVMYIAALASWSLFSISAWCAHVTVMPLESKTAVFSRGTEKGSIGFTAMGGHEHPISTAGASLLWKNAQKNPKKNTASEEIKIIIPAFSPVTTAVVCFPIYVPSRTMSRHQVNMFSAIRANAINSGIRFLVWNQSPKAANIVIAAKALVSGHGLKWTRW